MPAAVVMVHKVAASMSLAVVSENVIAASVVPESATAVVNTGKPLPQPSTVGASVPARKNFGNLIVTLLEVPAGIMMLVWNTSLTVDFTPVVAGVTVTA